MRRLMFALVLTTGMLAADVALAQDASSCEEGWIAWILDFFFGEEEEAEPAPPPSLQLEAGPSASDIDSCIPELAGIVVLS